MEDFKKLCEEHANVSTAEDFENKCNTNVENGISDKDFHRCSVKNVGTC